jgi:hypothetical protein
MSARVTIAWIFTILTVLLALGALLGFEIVRSNPDILVPGIGALVVIGGGLLYVMARGAVGEWGRLTFAAVAFVVSVGCLAMALFLDVVSNF